MGFNNKGTTVKTEESYSQGSQGKKQLSIEKIIEEENDENLCDFEKYVSYKKNQSPLFKYQSPTLFPSVMDETPSP